MVTCNVCGHSGDSHRFADPVVCLACPDHVCQDGPAGEEYRRRSSDWYAQRAATYDPTRPGYAQGRPVF